LILKGLFTWGVKGGEGFRKTVKLVYLVTACPAKAVSGIRTGAARPAVKAGGALGDAAGGGGQGRGN